MGLAQDVAVLGKLVATHTEGRQPLLQLHLHPQLCPCRQISTYICVFVLPIVAIVYAINTVAHCITWTIGRVLLPLSESVDHSNCHTPPIIVDDVGMQDKGPCPCQHHPQQHLIEVITLLEGDVVGLDEEAGNVGSLHIH